MSGLMNGSRALFLQQPKMPAKTVRGILGFMMFEVGKKKVFAIALCFVLVTQENFTADDVDLKHM